MTSLIELAQNRLEIKAILNNLKLEAQYLFKGFSTEEEHNLNISVLDTDEDNERDIYNRIIDAEDKLTNLLNCKIEIILKGDIESFYLPHIERTVNIDELANKSDQKEALKLLREYFGDNWEFNPNEKSSLETVYTLLLTSENNKYLFFNTDNQKTDSPTNLEQDVYSMITNNTVLLDFIANITNKLHQKYQNIDQIEIKKKIAETLIYTTNKSNNENIENQNQDTFSI